MTEEQSEKFKGLPGVVFTLHDSYIDDVKKEYGGDILSFASSHLHRTHTSSLHKTILILVLFFLGDKYENGVITKEARI
ncbi:hypothetical protein YC2023_048103 [Brassica napus]